MTKEVKVGEVYLGKVVRIEKFGAFVNLIKGKDGLVHISQLANERVNKVEDVVKEGDEILVKVTEIDKQGRVNLSRKALLNEDKAEKNKLLLNHKQSLGTGLCFLCLSSSSSRGSYLTGVIFALPRKIRDNSEYCLCHASNNSKMSNASYLG